MTTPTRRPWPVTDRNGLTLYGSAPGNHDPQDDSFFNQALDVGRAALPYVPIAGPAYDTYQDLRDGDYAGAAFNGLMLAADVTPIGPYAKALKMLKRVNGAKRTGLLARAGTAVARVRKAEAVPKGYEVHHTLPMAGWGPIPGANRATEGLVRNHPMMLKPLPKDVHRRLTGKWGDQPQFGPAMRAWHGTNAVQKSTATAVGATAADSWENHNRSVRPNGTTPHR